jgi:hypothetical protein
LQKETEFIKVGKETIEEEKEKGERNQAFIDEFEQATKGLMRQMEESESSIVEKVNLEELIKGIAKAKQ